MGRTIFSNANLLDGRNPAVPGSTVVVEGNRIISAGTQAVTPGPEDHHYDLRGSSVMPGMFMGHGHVQWQGLFDPNLYQHIFTGTERPPAVNAIAAARTCEAMLASGVTGFAGAGCSDDIDASLKIAVADGLLPGMRILASGRHINTTGHDNYLAKWWYDMNNLGFEVFADGPYEIRKAVREAINRGADIIKLYPTSGHAGADRGIGLTRDELDAAVRAAHERGKLVRAHAVWHDSILECIEAGVDLIDHGEQLDEKIIELMVAHGTYWVPSPLFLKVLAAPAPDTAGIDVPLGHEADDLENLRRMLPIANDAGVRIVPGDDFGLPMFPNRPGEYAKELSVYVHEFGIDALDVLRWATYHGGLLLGQQVGHLAEGWLADLIVVTGDPSADIRILEDPANHLQAVMVDGVFSRNDLTASNPR